MHSTSSDKPSSSNEKKDWRDLLNESVHTSDDVDIGDIYAVSKNFVVVMRGLINIHYYYIPISKVDGWDGKVLWLKITENQVKKIMKEIYCLIQSNIISKIIQTMTLVLLVIT